MACDIIDDRRRHQQPRGERKPLYASDRPLTVRQATILRYLRKMFAASGVVPGPAVIARRFQFSAAAATSCLRLLRDKGYIRMAGDQTRTMVLTDKR